MNKRVRAVSKTKIALFGGLFLSLSLGFVIFKNDSAQAESTKKTLKRFSANRENAVPLEFERANSPWIKLKQGKTINSEFSGTESAIGEFERGSLRPTTLAWTDFNFDGFPDIISGFAGTNGGVITLHRGWKEAFSPEDEQVLAGIRRGEFPVSFEKEAKVLEVPAAPDFIIAGSFVKSSPLDIVVATRGSNAIYILSSDSNGGFKAPQRILLDGEVSAIAADRFDSSKAFTGVSIGTKSGDLLIFDGINALNSSKPRRVSVGREINSLILASADGTTADRDLFILADGELSRIPQIGKQLQNPSRLDLPFRVNEFAVGEFIRDRRAKAEIAVLAENGSVYYLKNGTLDERAFTETEMRAHFAKTGRGRDVLIDSTDKESSLADRWTIAEEHNLGVYEFNKQTSQSLLQKAYITGNSTEDLLITNPTDGKIRVMFKEPNYEPNATSFSGGTRIENVVFPSRPIAALPIRLNVMGQQGIAVLEDGKLEPTPVMIAPNATFVVSKAADTADGVCNADCSLREAKIAANTAAGADIITFAANFTHQLTIAGADENTAATGDLDVTQPLTITGNGAASTILQAGTTTANGIDKIMSINPSFTSAFATSVTGVTFRFGRNPSSFATDGFGGAFDWEGSGTGTLTVSGVAITDNRTLDGDGGGVAITNSSPGSGNTSFTNTTFTSNIPTRTVGSSPFGGGMFVGTATKFALSGVTFTSNNVNGAGGQGQGGGILALGPIGSAGMPTIANSSFVTNAAPSDGGGIYTTQELTFTTPITFNGNTSGRFGGGLYSSITGTTSISKASFVNNAATTQGGGIFNNIGTLNVNFSRFNGNTGGGFTGLSVQSGTVNAENNWWSCNTGPSAAPCNTAGATGGTIDFDPWLQLRIGAGATTLVTGQTTTLTASFLTNSAGTTIAASNLDVLVGLGVTWGGTGATITSPQTTIQAAGTATSTFSAAAIGAKTGTATVDGATATVNITVGKANTSPVINSANLAASVVGQSIVVTYSVPAAAPGGGTPTGNVTVSDGVNSCTATVAAGQCSVALFTAGTRTLTAAYAGDVNYNAATSPGFSQVVNPANTDVNITSQSATTTNQGQTFTVFYSVAVVAPGAGTPTGNVTVSDGANSCTATVAAGQCTLFLNNAGARTLTATYAGSASYNSDVSPGVAHTVLPISAAGVAIDGRVLSAQRSGVYRAGVVITRSNGEVFTARTNSFGYFRIEGIPAGETYILTVNHRELSFGSQIITANEDVSGLEITAIE
jgi:CSLREA domain-containing protein